MSARRDDPEVAEATGRSGDLVPPLVGAAGPSAAVPDDPSDPSDPHRRPQRLPALDGLRGVAALVVVVFHVLLLSPTLADRGQTPSGVRVDDASWWLTHTPLYALWAGPQAVYLFFVLSGFVLTLPALAGGVRWRAYYPQRLLRLYLPVWGSLLLAVVLAAAVPREPRPALSGWYDAHIPVQGAGAVLRDALLIFGTDWINSPLWSLRWEVLFSLLLPLYLLAALRLRRLWALKALLLLVMVAVGDRAFVDELVHLPMFGLGVLLAVEGDRVAAAAARLAGTRARLVLLTGLCVALLTVEAGLLLVGLEWGPVRAAALVLTVVGACLAVVLALHSPGARRILGAPWVQWVGVRSFSLYLVHEPIAVTSGVLWPQLPMPGRLGIVLLVSLLVAHGFHRVVEVPAQRLSRVAARIAT